MFPLAWPSASLLAELAGDADDRHIEIATNALTSVFLASDAAMQRMGAASVWLPTALIRSGEPTRSSVELAT
jgi:hypothetical protein